VRAQWQSITVVWAVVQKMAVRGLINYGYLEGNICI